MLALFLVIALFFLLMLTLWAMARLRRAQLLRLLSAFMRRGLPLEPSLEALTELRDGSSHQRLAGGLCKRLAAGEPLGEALRALRVLSPQQAVALRVAEAHGASPALLAQLAAQAIQIERRALKAGALMLYPLITGVPLLFNTLFIYVFILPKFRMMMIEMEIKGVPSVEIFDLALGCVALVGVLLGWGLLAFSLQFSWLGRKLWWHVPALGTHFRMAEQARLARNMGLMLSAGATLERALGDIELAQAGGPMQRWIERVCGALNEGAPPPQAFSAAGRWREEFLWGLDAVAHGAPPGPAFAQVADVLEEKALARMDALHRVCTPIAVLIAASGVGLLAWTIFSNMTAIQRSMM